MWRYVLPLFGFIFLLILLGIGLTLNPREVPSPLIGKPAPDFELPRLREPDKTLSLSDLKGKVSLLNVWASWCQSCRAEHPLLLDVTRAGLLDVYGMNYKDEHNAAIDWLDKLGDPYKAIAFDHTGRVGIDFGVYGTPESYLIDQKGTIVYKKIGPITPDDWQQDIWPLVQTLRSKQP